MKIFLRLFILGSVIAAAVYCHQSGLFERGLDQLNNLGFWKAPVFMLLYVLTAVLFFPSFVFSFAGGVLFGFPLGLALSVAGAGLGAAAAFMLGRTVAHDAVWKRCKDNKQFQLLNAMVEHEGWKIIVLARLSPIFPFSIGNYAFGLSKLKAWQYGLASLIGTIPSSAVYVYAGTLATSLTDYSSRQKTPADWALLVLGLAATVGLSLYLKKVAERMLARDREKNV